MQKVKGMSLARALRIERGSVVSLVGGGGKTTAMFRLAAELSSAGMRTVATSTTHINEEQALIPPAAIRPDRLDELSPCLDRHGQCLIIGAPDGKGRVGGVSKEFIAGLRLRPDVDAILIEADGSRSLPFKAPGEHEPVVSEWTTVLVPVAGMNAVGLPLDEEHVHRAAIAASLANEKPGAPVSPETIARVLAHPKGGAKHCPAAARLIPLLNKADVSRGMDAAARIAGMLLADPAVDSAIVSSMTGDPPVREVWTPVAGIVLAAGPSSRFGATKQILPWGNSTLVARCAKTALDAGLDPVIAVLGRDAEKTAEALAGLPVRLAYNPDFCSGRSSSIRKGLEALPLRAGAAMFLPADHSFAGPALVKALVEAHRRTLAPACAPSFEGRRGGPALFDKALFRELRELSGDDGEEILLEKHRDAVVSVPAGPDVLPDIDAPEGCEGPRKYTT